MPEPLREATAETLWRKHVEVRFGAVVTDFDGHKVTLKGGEVIPAQTLIWAAGVRAAALLDGAGLAQGRLGRVVVTPTLQTPTYPDVFVIGDAAYLEHAGQPLPMVAPVAMQQAEVAAENIQRLIAQHPLRPFDYHNPGSLATIGRNAAVAQLGRFQFRGWVAWGLWLGVHIIQLIGFRNRLLVLINWAWDYVFYERGVRIISGR
jgi:NADH dehydrogenase